MLMHISVSRSVSDQRDTVWHKDLLVDEVLHLGQIESLAVILLGSLLKESDSVD